MVKRIGVLMGGTSSEREVSLRSGRAISDALRQLGYTVIDIDAGPNVCADIKREGIEAAFWPCTAAPGRTAPYRDLLEVMGIPYTGSGVLASALAMDKPASKIFFRARV